MVRESEFNEQAMALLPLKGIIKESYILTDEEVLTPDDLQGVVQHGNDDEESFKKVNIYTL